MRLPQIFKSGECKSHKFQDPCGSLGGVLATPKQLLGQAWGCGFPEYIVRLVLNHISEYPCNISFLLSAKVAIPGKPVKKAPVCWCAFSKDLSDVCCKSLIGGVDHYPSEAKCQEQKANLGIVYWVSNTKSRRGETWIQFKRWSFRPPPSICTWCTAYFSCTHKG